ncbi:hypothetical protein SISSUDRAFT_708560 [Sistotremastrum suecicum HHB10207 ss-3]|uniref:F-box domain-containing protein n=1 Tax=Sistotremastrum suecicum HHB10207 ss-3 TaxID=1314776 RepID=A0A166DUL5_9AGAM|nr:hypothetical protein SISSUDRAFT_708560 [Sistotremastrum suecicum HHB10207 ss-3]
MAQALAQTRTSREQGSRSLKFVTSTMDHISSLAPELLFLILDGFCLEDIVHFAQTSKHAYEVICGSYAVWVNASDSHRIPVETGYTLQTTPPHRLYGLSLRAISLSERFNARVVRPKNITHFHTWNIEENSQHSQSTPTPVIHVLPGNQWILVAVGKRHHDPSPPSWRLHRVDKPNGAHFPVLDASHEPVSVEDVVSEVTEDGSVVVATTQRISIFVDLRLESLRRSKLRTSLDASPVYTTLSSSQMPILETRNVLM